VKDSFDIGQEVQDALGQSEEVVKGLQNQVANLTHEKQQEQAMKERVQAALEENQSSLKDTAAELEKTAAELAETQNKLQSTESDLTSTTGKPASVTASLKSLDAEYTQAKIDHAAAVDAAASEKMALETDMSALTASKAEVDAALVGTQAMLDATIPEWPDRGDELALLTSDHANLNLTLEALQSEHADLINTLIETSTLLEITTTSRPRWPHTVTLRSVWLRPRASGTRPRMSWLQSTSYSSRPRTV
jgi:chromosome segregation ATPase